MSPALRSAHVVGTVLGSAVGDALGAPFEPVGVRFEGRAGAVGNSRWERTAWQARLSLGAVPGLKVR
ncbi:ADP-ribosylglycohydrolase family protein [Streptomyces ficellus]|uniref:ADP-ribosylglycohydrolase family protein n=1 Tax=Streptomyces ficellus TaxID=1977088 RepID=A0A6I6FEA1_9ACTN|nr:ADP-ribosylglycohydrolase family protein [Streptomyces ficellus]QGV81514.1 hypothetical protein EIZ62_27110 [Streptomyces ficellus]